MLRSTWEDLPVLVYLVVLCLVGWGVSRLIVSCVPKWWMVMLATAIAFAAVLAAGLGIMAVEAGQVGAQGAVQRFAGSLIPALIACIWFAMVTYRRSRSGKDPVETLPQAR